MALALLWLAMSGTANAAAVPAASAYAAWRPLLARAAAVGQADAPADLYKLLYQGVMGPAHAALTEEDAVVWLAREGSALAGQAEPPGAAWPLLEPVRPDSLLVRVHLRPLIALGALAAAGAAPDSAAEAGAAPWRRLAAAFVRTARGWRGDTQLLARLWTRAAADETLWPAAADAVARAAFTDTLARRGWPAVHHDEAFARARAPHYRVVARDELPGAWLAAAGWPVPSGAGGGGDRCPPSP